MTHLGGGWTINISPSLAGVGGGGIVNSVWVITTEIVEVQHRAKWSQALSITWSCSAIGGPILGGIFSGTLSPNHTTHAAHTVLGRDGSGIVNWRWGCKQHKSSIACPLSFEFSLYQPSYLSGGTPDSCSLPSQCASRRPFWRSMACIGGSIWFRRIVHLFLCFWYFFTVNR
jgi:MFS family permease